jgi:hypothetical protein
MSRNPYGRPYRRRKGRALLGRPSCFFCGKPIEPGSGTLHHDPPVSSGKASPFGEYPAHKTCNAEHGAQLGGARAAARRADARVEADDLDSEFDRPAPRRDARPSSRYPRVWPGAIDVEIDGPAEIIKPGGIVIRVERGQRYVP